MSQERIDVVDELFKPRRINFPRKRVILKGIADLFQADLMEFPDDVRHNRGCRYVLVVINCFSKHLWCVPLKNKTGELVTQAMEGILQNTLVPKNIQTDKGTEFYNATFKALMKKYNINHYSTHSITKSQIVERVIRTVKTWIYKEFFLRGHRKWIEFLDEIVYRYNNRVHRSIGCRPSEVNKVNEDKILQRLENNASQPKKAGRRRRIKFVIGDKVRISRSKQMFEKGYTFNWTPEIYTITEIKDTHLPVTYKIADAQDNEILGQFYGEELSKVKHENVYLVEKVLQKKGRLCKLRWLGFDKSHDSWELISESFM